MTKYALTRFKAKKGSHEAVVTSYVNAARDRVWDVYTNPRFVPCWWGPEEYITTVDTMRLEQGGRWRFVQNDPGGQVYGFHGVYHEIMKPEKLVYTFEYEGLPDHVILETVTFTEQNGRTKITEKTVFQSVADRDGMIRAGMKEGAVESMDRLAELLENMNKAAALPGTVPGREIVIERHFSAPREELWRACTEPERIRRWWGPRGYKTPFVHIDLCEGSRYLFCMQSPEGKRFWSTGVFREIIPMERITATDSFADEKGSPVPASYYGFAENFPPLLLFTFEFHDTGGASRLTVRHTGLPDEKTAQDTRNSWMESLDKLAESLG